MWYYYRVQHRETKEGPYVSEGQDGRKLWACGKHGMFQGRPDPARDNTGEEGTLDVCSIPYVAVFGFVTLTQLQAWFRPEELRKLSDLDYEIVRVRGERVWESELQACFVPV